MRAALVAAFGLGAIGPLSGCAVQWDLNYDVASSRARSQNKPMLLYFKDWSSPEHRELVVNLFENPTVAKELAQTVNCELLHNWGPEAKRYNTLNSPQTFVFCRPDGTEVGRLAAGKSGITPQKFAEWIRKCRSEMAGSAPPPAPPAGAAREKAAGTASVAPADDAPASNARPSPAIGHEGVLASEVDVESSERAADDGGAGAGTTPDLAHQSP